MTVEGVRKNPDAAFAAKEYFQVLMHLGLMVIMPKSLRMGYHQIR